MVSKYPDIRKKWYPLIPAKIWCFLKLKLLIFWFLGLGDNADEDTTNAGKESEQQKNDLKKIHDKVDDDTKGQ